MWAVPSVADLRDRTLPRGLEPAAVKKLLASCDRRRLVGRRDYAILLLLSRLGLRAGEVAAIGLDDIDWRGRAAARSRQGQPAGRVAVAGGCRRGGVSYLRRRPRCECRALFLRVTAPRQGLNRSTVGWVVRAACDRAGLAARRRPPSAAHRRDRDAQGGRVARGDRPGACATASRRPPPIYAKVDRKALRALARPWPSPEGVRHDHASRSAGRLSADPPPARVRDAPGRPAAGRVRRVPRAGRR